MDVGKNVPPKTSSGTPTAATGPLTSSVRFANRDPKKKPSPT
jgi:hypothetical protein